jgi:hypothetical protein
MFFKKSIKKLENEINQYLKEGDYFNAGIIAENSGYSKLKELSKTLFEISVNKAIENIYLENIKREKVIPSKICYNNITNLNTPCYYLKNNLKDYYIKN